MCLAVRCGGDGRRVLSSRKTSQTARRGTRLAHRRATVDSAGQKCRLRVYLGRGGVTAERTVTSDAMKRHVQTRAGREA